MTGYGGYQCWYCSLWEQVDGEVLHCCSCEQRKPEEDFKEDKRYRSRNNRSRQCLECKAAGVALPKERIYDGFGRPDIPVVPPPMGSHLCVFDSFDCGTDREQFDGTIYCRRHLEIYMRTSAKRGA